MRAAAKGFISSICEKGVVGTGMEYATFAAKKATEVNLPPHVGLAKELLQHNFNAIARALKTLVPYEEIHEDVPQEPQAAQKASDTQMGRLKLEFDPEERLVFAVMILERDGKGLADFLNKHPNLFRAMSSADAQPDEQTRKDSQSLNATHFAQALIDHRTTGHKGPPHTGHLMLSLLFDIQLNMQANKKIDFCEILSWFQGHETIHFTPRFKDHIRRFYHFLSAYHGLGNDFAIFERLHASGINWTPCMNFASHTFYMPLNQKCFAFCQFTGCTFSQNNNIIYCDLSSAIFTSCRFQQTKFANTNLKDTRIYESVLEDVKIQGCFLEGLKQKSNQILKARSVEQAAVLGAEHNPFAQAGVKDADEEEEDFTLEAQDPNSPLANGEAQKSNPPSADGH